MKNPDLPFLKIKGNRAGLEIYYWASRAAAMSFAAANPDRVSIKEFGIMSGMKNGIQYVALNVFSKAALKRELAEIEKEKVERAARAAARAADIAAGRIFLPSEIIPSELGI